MKTQELTLKGIVLMAILVLSTLAYSQDDFTKKFHHDFNKISEATLVDISNKYGDVTIKDWSKNSVSVDVIITVKTKNEDKARKVFDKIEINFKEEGNAVKAFTEITDGIRNTKFSIDYEVNMPKNLKLLLINKYGGVFVNELTNHVDLTIKYGKLKVNKLTNGDTDPKSEVKIAYSKGEIKEANWLKLFVSYSSFELEKGYATMMVSKYSKIDIGETKSLVVESKYDSEFDVEKVKNIVLNGKYSNYDFGEISKIIDVEAKYSDFEVAKVPKEFDKIDVKLKYGHVDIEIEKGASYNLDAQVEYGSIDYPDSDNVNKMCEKFASKINGLIGKNSNTKAKVTVITKYGDVNLE